MAPCPAGASHTEVVTVRLTFPADAQHVTLARTMAAAVAAHADLPIDQIEDLRLAVSEAVTQVMGDAPPDGTIECAFDDLDGDLHVTVAAPTTTGMLPSTDSFGWAILRALVADLMASIDGSHVRLTMRLERRPAIQVT